MRFANLFTCLLPVFTVTQAASLASSDSRWILAQRIFNGINDAYKIITQSDILKMDTSNEHFYFTLARELFQITEKLSEEAVRGLELYLETGIYQMDQELLALANNGTNTTSSEYVQQQQQVENLTNQINLARTIVCSIKMGARQGINLAEILNNRINDNPTSSNDGTSSDSESTETSTSTDTNTEAATTTAAANTETTTAVVESENSDSVAQDLLDTLSNSYIINEVFDRETLLPIFEGIQSLLDLTTDVLNWQVEDLCVYAEQQHTNVF